MKKFLFVLALFVVLPAFAQSVPNGTITQGQVWTPAQWNAAWQAKTDVLAPAATPQRFTATGGQTVFNLTAVPASSVSLDGVQLTPTIDYTIAGNTLTLTNGALAGQVLYVR